MPESIGLGAGTLLKEMMSGERPLVHLVSWGIGAIKP
jgi:hypothetical protein